MDRIPLGLVLVGSVVAFQMWRRAKPSSNLTKAAPSGVSSKSDIQQRRHATATKIPRGLLE